MNKQIGFVTHYFDKIGVAVLKLSAPLKIGDTVKFSGHDQEFTQLIKSIELDHQSIKKAKKGQDIAVKVEKPVKDKDRLYIDS